MALLCNSIKLHIEAGCKLSKVSPAECFVEQVAQSLARLLL